MKSNSSLNGSYTKVGFPSGAPVAQGEETSMIDVATNAAILNFGISTSSGVKRWPFMTTAMTANKRRIQELLRKGSIKVYEEKSTAKQVLGIIGEDMVGKIQDEMRNISTPREEDSTIKAKKGVSNPTINTGQMLNSVTHKEVINE